ncbi:hypothetical protein PZE06_21245 [Robertmurraya sp. DFI.2.37]|uniref:hypothetical protein n=1 Tax=Robertmurraya sp. DFI.2.37 TaxID=3031819 RepID=UPI001246B29D|nr:hypothetical protein [Robertmurraya sp. DFI.2.37]MDF1510664.1 hypothetical protein [Robertmurraya sp. DFI.2.37]
MNIVVERTRMKYRNVRERAYYNIIDIEYHLKSVAIEGLIWCLQDMPDMTKAEEILINNFLDEYREYQEYDDIRNPLHPQLN